MPVRSVISVLLLISGFIYSQNVTIKIKGKSYAGKDFEAYTYDDYITYTQKLVGFAVANDSGYCEMKLDVKSTTYLFLRSEKQKASIYVSPGKIYQVVFPPRDTSEYISPESQQTVNLFFYMNDTNDINARIMDYNIKFEKFYRKNIPYFIAKRLRHRLDSFVDYMDNRYKNVKDPYFKTFYRYSIAGVEESTFQNQGEIKRLYVVNKPVYPQNFNYMDFFNMYFKQYLMKLAAREDMNDMYPIINEKASYPALMELLKKDPVLVNDTLRELVMLKGLGEFYYNPNFSRIRLVTLLESVTVSSKNAECKKIAYNLIKSFTKLQAGMQAPVFLLKDLKGKAYSLLDFTDKYIYLSFLSTSNISCQEELKQIPELKKKFGDRIIFITIATDKDKGSLEKFILKNPKYDWLFLFHEENADAKSQYDVKTVPMFYLIDSKQNFVQCPAKRPSELIEIDFEKMFAVKKKTFVPGDKRNQR